jgi:hypothetical protein
MQVNVRHDLGRLRASLEQYPKEAMAAARRSINRSITTVRREAVKRLRAILPGLKVGSILRQIKLMRASARAPTGSLAFSAARFRLANFHARQTTRGVRLRSMPWRLETLEGERVDTGALARAFIARARSNKKANHVWIRTGKSRYPITALLAPSLAEAFVARGIGEALVVVGRARFAVVYEQEMKFRLGKKGVVI